MSLVESNENDTREQKKVCPECRCVLHAGSEDLPASKSNPSHLCDYCLLDRLRKGEKVFCGTHTFELMGRATPVTEDLYVVLCGRCKGTGEFIVTAWQPDTYCFACSGNGWVLFDSRETRRMQRWSQTFQSNKVKEVEK